MPVCSDRPDGASFCGQRGNTFPVRLERSSIACQWFSRFPSNGRRARSGHAAGKRNSTIDPPHKPCTLFFQGRAGHKQTATAKVSRPSTAASTQPTPCSGTTSPTTAATPKPALPTSLSAPQHQRIWPPYSRLGSTEQEFASRTPASNLHTGPGKRLMSRERPTRCQAPQQLTSTMMVRCLALHGCWSTNHPGGQAISGIRKIIVTLTNRTTPERLTGSHRGWVWPTAGGVRCQFKSQKDTVPRSG